ncbi:MAG TPA: fluoride efflux transporter CrcB [Oligoflexia bacterium]|nr:fluoride efflux transporter CrcB [Oligoflexia bacterium]HMP27036.1 fluoride efflux transporter CrcB [Oligoflexia bacterium]
MRELLIVGAGSFIGGVARYFLGGLIGHLAVSFKFPLGTLFVNLVGCFFIGVLAALSGRYYWFSQEMRLFFATGLLGGFTTFSAFGYDTILLLKNQDLTLALLNVFLSIFLCLFAVWLGMRLFE